MVLFLQYTFTDLRSFSDQRNSLLTKPSWPTPHPFKEFVRGSGQIIPRSKQGINNWIGENYICKINRGLKIKDAIPVSKLDYYFRNVGKHQYSSDGLVLNKYEFVFASKSFSNGIIGDTLMMEIINSILNAPIAIRTIDFSYLTTKISNLISPLLDFYIITSTKANAINLEEQRKHIEYCSPQIFISLDESEMFDYNSKRFIRAGKGYFRHIFSKWESINNRPYKIWVSQMLTRSSQVAINRKLRISMLRLHAEFECLKNVLQAASNGALEIDKMSRQSDRLQSYFNHSITTILQEEKQVKEEYSENDYIKEFLDIFRAFEPGELDIAKDRILSFGFRPQIEKKVFNYITQKIEIMEDKYEFHDSQVGAAGRNAKSEHNIFKQANYSIPSNLDFGQLSQELATLKNSLKEHAQNSDEFASLQKVAHAEEEAKQKNGNAVVRHLKEGGKWVFDVATRIGVSLVTDLIKNNMT